MGLNDGLAASVAATERSFRAALAPHCSPGMLALILRCVHADPRERPTCAELQQHGSLRDADGSPKPHCHEDEHRPGTPSDLLRWLNSA
jgi:hypothetical protein